MDYSWEITTPNDSNSRYFFNPAYEGEKANHFYSSDSDPEMYDKIIMEEVIWRPSTCRVPEEKDCEWWTHP